MMRVASAVLALLTAGGLLVGCELTAYPDGCAPRQGSALAGPPTRLAINHDDFDAKHVGRTVDGQQFFLTEPFDIGTEGGTARLFVALYVFAGTGRFLDAEIDAFDEVPGHSAAVRETYDRRLKELGDVTFGRIEVEPFSVERFGLTFGLVGRAPETADDIWWVTAEPGDYMAFSAPWDCGEYDT